MDLDVPIDGQLMSTKVGNTLDAGFASLMRLSNDVIGLITLMLPGKSIQILIACGNRQLSSRIMRSCQSLSFLLDLFVPFPFSAFHFPRLQFLSVTSIHPVPIKLNGILPIPSTPFSPLTELVLSMPQSFIVLAFQGDIPMLEAQLPNLTSLKLINSTKPLSRDHLLAIPQSLLHLDLRTSERYQFPAPVELPCQDLSLFPSSLESLSIHSIKFLIDTTRDDCGATFPPQLKHLSMWLFDSPLILKRLPSELENLFIGFKNSNGPVVTFPMSCLPQSLIHCEVMVLDGNFNLVSDGIFPPNLLSLTSPIEYNHVNELVGLPTSLHYFASPYGPAINNIVSAGLINEILPELRALHILVPKTPDLMTNLPSKLETFQCLADISQFAFSFPATLTDLNVPFFNGFNMNHLPRGLKILTFLRHPPRSNFLPQHLDLLPQQLRELTLSVGLISTVESFDHLPQSLEILKLHFPDGMVHENIAMNPNLPRFFPKHIQDLIIVMDHSKTVLYDWLCNLQHLTQLHSLTVHSFSKIVAFQREMNVDNRFFGCLPPSLRTLDVAIATNLSDHVTVLHSLPPKLTYLAIEGLSAYPLVQAINANFSQLPKSLTSIKLRTLYGLNSKVLFLLPPTIAMLYISPPNLKQEELDAYYKRNSIWEGYRPPQ
jgi:hypothetical protein